jgi:glycosyltransferase involved in cell wall biosynthesis
MMKNKIDVFLPHSGYQHTLKSIEELQKDQLVNKIFLITTDNSLEEVKGAYSIYTDNFNSTKTIRQIAENSSADYVLIFTQDDYLEMGQHALTRFFNVADSTGAGMVYSNYYEIKNGEKTFHPVIDYQLGSLRDDFNFGHLLFYNNNALKNAVAEMKKEYTYAGLYDLRLKVSQTHQILRMPEFLYTSIELDSRDTGEKQFDYVDPKNRKVQIEMEQAVTEHLKAIDAYLPPKFETINFENDNFNLEASVIIPVFNRANTIKDAVVSVMNQKTDFDFNLIVVDNHSTDGTTELLTRLSEKYSNLIHIIPERTDLGIGGCWNVAVDDERCGRFSLQLDSDDIYANENTVQTIVEKFREEKCAMVIGSYRITNFDLEDIPPGLIDHKEWTPDNGRNNALRINGLGAPRAFYTPLLRKIRIPNVSYGEDYAVGLEISRNYQIGRIYTPIYLCRRWNGNSDASLNIEKTNAYNTYKDRVRTIEVLARQRMNK